MTDSKALIERLRADWPEILVEKHWMMDSDAIEEQRREAADAIEELDRHLTLSGKVNKALSDRIEKLEADNARLRKLTCATWFYMPDEGDRCWFSPHEVIDEMYDPEPGNHVFEVECATSLPSIWCAVRVTDDPDADERFTFTEHATEAEARAALQETSHDA